ncbi:MAG: transporter substrate-binding domain-containing protein [Pseudomonadota bacterium]
MIDAPVLAVPRMRSLDRRQCLKMALGLAWAGPAVTTSAQSIKPRMKVGFIAHYQPYSFLQADGSLTGFDVEVVKALLDASGFEMVPVTDSLTQLRKKLRDSEIDFIGNQLLRTPENRRQFDFVNSYATIQLVTVLHEDDDRDFLSLENFLGKNLGVLSNTGIDEQARGVLGKTVRGFERIEDALRALAERKLDAVLEENLIAEYFIERDELPLKVGTPFAAPIRAGLAVPKGNKNLENRLNEAVKNLVKAPRFKAISSRWFGYDVSRPRVSFATGV